MLRFSMQMRQLKGASCVKEPLMVLYIPHICRLRTQFVRLCVVLFSQFPCYFASHRRVCKLIWTHLDNLALKIMLFQINLWWNSPTRVFKSHINEPVMKPKAPIWIKQNLIKHFAHVREKLLRNYFLIINVNRMFFFIFRGFVFMLRDVIEARREN